MKELVYDQDKNKQEATNKTNVASNLIAAGDLNITSNVNNLISGSNLSANNINLTATTGATIITSAQDQSSISTENINQDYNDFSLDYNRGRVSANSNFRVDESTSTISSVTQKQSNLNAVGNINITSNQDLNILSSNLSANNGATTLTSSDGNVNILSLQNTTTSSTETRSGNMNLSAGIGNSHVDTAYAASDLVDAAKAFADAKKELNHMKTLKDNGQADGDAVKDAETNFAIAYANFVLAEIKVAAAAAKSATSASSLWTGFYGDIRLSIDGTKTNSSQTSATSVASNINSNGNLVINSGMNLLANNSDLITGTVGNTIVTGSNLASTSGDINITSRNDTTINASKDTFKSGSTSKSWNESITLASSAGSGSGAAIDNMVNNAVFVLGAGMSRSSADTSSVTYNNSTLNASNGNITLTSLGTTASGTQTGGDTTLKGANLLGQDITLNVGNNLDVESLQNSYLDKSKSFGMNLGGSSGTASGSSSVNAGINYSSNKTDRLWTDNQTSIIGTDSVTINVANNTNITGAVIANSTNGIVGAGAIDGGNLILNTNSLTFSNLDDHYYTKNTGFGISTNIGSGLNNSQGQGTATATNPIQQNNFYPNGSTTLSMQNESTKKEGLTNATIGSGTINIASNSDISNLNRDITQTQVITKDQITGALNGSVTIDNRIIAAVFGNDSAADSLANDQKNLAGNIGVTGIAIGVGIKDAITSVGDINPNDPKNDSYLEVLSNKTKLRTDSLFNLTDMLKESKNAKYYDNPNDNKDGYRDPETGEIFINLARTKDLTPEGQNQFLLNLTLHETAHGDSSYDTISKQTEEGLVRNQTATASDLINFYHNTGNYSDSTASSLTSWAYSNSSVGDQYNLGSNSLNNLYSNSTQNVTPQSIVNNNAIAAKADENKIEPLVVKIEGTDQYFYFQQKPGSGYRVGITTEKDGRYIDPAPSALSAEQTITFNNDNKNGNSPDQKVSFKLADTLEALSNEKGFSFNVNSTSGGNHSPTSNHYLGRAADINNINGNRVINNSSDVGLFQTIANTMTNIRENFGPALQTKTVNGIVKNNPVPGHLDHVHISTQK